MLHSIPTDKFGPFGSAMAGAVQACVHCGFCLAACPTYQELGQEMDTPRGRIVLMKQVLEGNLALEAAQPHVDRCLGCLACEPACPSGVRYRDLINPFRTLSRSKLRIKSQATSQQTGDGRLTSVHFPYEQERQNLSQPGGKRVSAFRSQLLALVLPFPNRFRLAVRMGSVVRHFSPLIPRALKAMLDLLPAELPGRVTLPPIIPAVGDRRARVALLAGCVQQVLDPDINKATVEVLSRNGVEVVIPPSQVCCGGLAWHTGDLLRAQHFARCNLAAFPNDVDAIVTNAAGCGSTMHEYNLILRGTPDEATSHSFCQRVMDVSLFLARLGLRPAAGLPEPRRVAYQDACHLAHAQNVSAEPRTLLRAISDVELVELADPHLCCGSAGTYNIDQPEIAGSLGEKKARAVIATGAHIVASGNIGCLNQIRLHLTRLGSAIQVRHTMQVLRDSYEPLRQKK